MKIIWSVDAFEFRPETISKTAEWLRLLSSRSETQIEPVYILSADRLSLPEEMPAESRDSYAGLARKQLDALLNRAEVPNLNKPAILIQSTHSTTKSAQTLIDHARAQRADLIVIASHGLRGAGRFFLGSFAESVLLLSDIPVLTVGQRCQAKCTLDEILFATDFTAASKRALDKVIRFAAMWKSQLTLFHFVPHPIDPIIQAGVNVLGGGWVTFHDYVNDVEKAQTEELEKWAEPAGEAGLKVKCHATSAAMNSAQGILSQAAIHEYGLIAVGAHSGPVASTILGSVSREIVREAPRPVLVIRS